MSQQLSLPPLSNQQGLIFLWNYLVGHAHPRAALDLDERVLQFVSHCFAGFRQSHAQLFQDLYVTFRLPGARSGYFVEFGATDGVSLSNTCYLERTLGWTGILAEPMPRWHADLKAARRATIDTRCVWWESGRSLEFVATRETPELSTLAEFADADLHAKARLDGETIRVDSVSLNDLLVEHGAPGTIDYLSIDTEGSELDILSAFDFDRFKVRVLTVEHNYNEEARAAMHQLLGAHGFVRELEIFSRFDDWYFHPERV